MNSINTFRAKNPYEKLEPLIDEYCSDQKPHIYLHPTEYGTSAVSPGLRDYTEEELDALAKRDFETRLFITATAIEGSSVWLRTRWSDNHVRNSTFNVVRDYFKAMHGTKNFTAAKSALSEALTMCMESEKSNYYSFAISLASGLSNMGRNTSFQVHDAIIKTPDEINLARRKLCLMMHIIFSKIESSDFLCSAEGSNIYRLVFCMTVVSKQDALKLLIPIFSFLLQIMLTVFVFFENFTEEHFRFKTFLGENEEEVATNLKINVVLAVVTFVYSCFVAAPGITEMKPAFKFYGGFGLLHTLDFIINTILPFVILVSGFFVSFISMLLCNASNIV